MKYLDIVPYEKCTGCGMCANICPKNAVNMAEDDEGFLYPNVEKSKCISCGLCEKHCTVKHGLRSELEPIGAYSFYLNNLEMLKESASGGAATALANVFIKNNGVVYACTYDDTFCDAVFSKCESIEDFKAYKSSIYFNTQPMDQKVIKSILDSGKECMVVGLPCQIAALRNYIGKNDRLLCVSLICGGQEPRTLHRKVLNEVLAAHPGEEIAAINYRYKKKDWNTSCLKVSFKSGKYNLGGGAFRMEVIRKCCNTCAYKIDNSFADIVIGDFWGSEYLGEAFHSRYGTSVILVLTENGRMWIERTAGIGTLNEVSISDTYKTNKAITSVKKINPKRDQIIQLIKTDSLHEAQKKVLGKKGFYLRHIKYTIKGMFPDILVRTIKRIKNK